MSIATYNIETITRGERKKKKRNNPCGCSNEKHFFSTSRHCCKCHYHSNISYDVISGPVKKIKTRTWTSKTQKASITATPIWTHWDLWSNLWRNVVLKKAEGWFTLIPIPIPISSQMDRSVCAVVKTNDGWASLLSDIPSSTGDKWYFSHTTKKKVSNYTFVILCFIVFISISCLWNEGCTKIHPSSIMKHDRSVKYKLFVQQISLHCAVSKTLRC